MRDDGGEGDRGGMGLQRDGAGRGDGKQGKYGERGIGRGWRSQSIRFINQPIIIFLASCPVQCQFLDHVVWFYCCLPSIICKFARFVGL